MAYKNSFCKTGKSKSGLRMDRSPLGAHCFKKNYTPVQFNTKLEKKAEAGDFDDNPNFKKAIMDNKGMPMNDRGGVLNYGTSMMNVNAGICPSCRKNKKSCSKKACPGSGMAKKVEDREYVADDPVSKAGLDAVGQPRGKASEFTRGRTSRKYKKAEDLELRASTAANEGNERRARRLAKRAERKRKRADKSRSAQEVMATEMFAKGYSESNSAFDDPKSKHHKRLKRKGLLTKKSCGKRYKK
jgi:hypothetical protein